MPQALPYIGAGLSLYGGIKASGAARAATRTSQQGVQVAGQNAARTTGFLPINGFTTSTGIGGPSFTFGGQTGRVTVAPQNPNATSGAIQQGTIGQTTGTGIFQDTASGQFFNAATGEIIPESNLQVIEPGGSAISINQPDFGESDALIRSAFGNVSQLTGISQELEGLAAQFSDTSNLNAEQLMAISGQAGLLLDEVAVGASEFREASLAQINNAEQSTISDLTESMARRRIGGSSFANDTLSRSRAEFAQARSEVEAQSRLQEISATSEILSFQADVINTAGQRLLDGLTGQGNALGAAASTAASAGALAINAGTALAANQVNAFNAESQALTLAFQGQQNAQQFITDTLGLVNQATEIQTNAITGVANAQTNQASLYGDIAGAGLSLMGGGFGQSMKPKTSSGGGGGSGTVIGPVTTTSY